MNVFEKREKRLNVRRAFRSKIVFEDEFGQGLIYLYSKDISLSGIFLEQTPPLKLGAHLFLSFLLPGKKRPLKLVGEVVRFVEYDLNETPALRQGAGVRFLDMDPKSRQVLAGFLNEKN